MKNAIRGFTLVEMSIVVVIISVFVAGILFSSDLTRSSKLLQIIVQVDEFNNAVNLFRNKYKELPGDLPNAETFWGSDTACPNTASTATARKETCNGDGNGNISTAFTDSGVSDYESFRAWQQMANAGLITGAYTGTKGSVVSNHAIPGVNVPLSAITATGFSLLYIFLPSGNADYWPMIYGHSFIYGNKTTSSITNGAGLTPKEAFLIDQKSDDGKPAYGRIVANKSTIAPNCTTSDVATTATYNFTYATVGCNLIFISGW